tara:strand:+ start:15843 stop:17081 length:1239 start_codon:yes stop_codon:yes gene_type:complete
MSGTDEQISGDEALDQQAHLLRAERQIAWLRWIGMVGWVYILLSQDMPLQATGWAVYFAGLLYTLVADLMLRFAAPIGTSARITTIGDPLLTTAMCLVTGGLSSVFFPFYYFTLLAAAFRYGKREAIAVFVFNVFLACTLYAALPGDSLRTLAVAIFYLIFSGLLGVLLVNWAEENLAIAHERSRALQGARDRARMLLKRLIHSQEDERKRIAGDIHDRMSGHLFSLRQNLDRIADNAQSIERLHQPLKDLDAEVRDTSAEVRRLMNGLRPTVLDDLGLAPAIEEYISELRETLPFDLTLEIDPALEAWHSASDASVFRILQEALLNARKHAKARHVTVQLERHRPAGRSDIVLTVSDDGAGFDLSAGPRFGHLGLLTMRERAEAVGGQLDIASTPGKGTTIIATIPEDRHG